MITERHQPYDPHIQISDSFKCYDKQLLLLMTFKYSMNWKPCRLVLVAPRKFLALWYVFNFSLCTLFQDHSTSPQHTSVEAHDSSKTTFKEYYVIQSNMILLCSIKLKLTIMWCKLIAFFCWGWPTLEEIFGIMKEEQDWLTASGRIPCLHASKL